MSGILQDVVVGSAPLHSGGVVPEGAGKKPKKLANQGSIGDTGGDTFEPRKPSKESQVPRLPGLNSQQSGLNSKSASSATGSRATGSNATDSVRNRSIPSSAGTSASTDMMNVYFCPFLNMEAVKRTMKQHITLHDKEVYLRSLRRHYYGNPYEDYDHFSCKMIYDKLAVFYASDIAEREYCAVWLDRIKSWVRWRTRPGGFDAGLQMMSCGLHAVPDVLLFLLKHFLKYEFPDEYSVYVNERHCKVKDEDIFSEETIKKRIRIQILSNSRKLAQRILAFDPHEDITAQKWKKISLAFKERSQKYAMILEEKRALDIRVQMAAAMSASNADESNMLKSLFSSLALGNQTMSMQGSNATLDVGVSMAPGASMRSAGASMRVAGQSMAMGSPDAARKVQVEGPVPIGLTQPMNPDARGMQSTGAGSAVVGTSALSPMSRPNGMGSSKDLGRPSGVPTRSTSHRPTGESAPNEEGSRKADEGPVKLRSGSKTGTDNESGSESGMSRGNTASSRRDIGTAETDTMSLIAELENGEYPVLVGFDLRRENRKIEDIESRLTELNVDAPEEDRIYCEDDADNAMQTHKSEIMLWRNEQEKKRQEILKQHNQAYGGSDYNRFRNSSLSSAGASIVMKAKVRGVGAVSSSSASTPPVTAAGASGVSGGTSGITGVIEGPPGISGIPSGPTSVGGITSAASDPRSILGLDIDTPATGEGADGVSGGIGAIPERKSSLQIQTSAGRPAAGGVAAQTAQVVKQLKAERKEIYVGIVVHLHNYIHELCTEDENEYEQLINETLVNPWKNQVDMLLDIVLKKDTPRFPDYETVLGDYKENMREIPELRLLKEFCMCVIHTKSQTNVKWDDHDRRNVVQVAQAWLSRKQGIRKAQERMAEAKALAEQQAQEKREEEAARQSRRTARQSTRGGLERQGTIAPGDQLSALG